MRIAPVIELNKEEKQTLESWTRSHTIERRLAERASIILLSATGKQNKEIATELRTREATVSKWRNRFHRDRIKGLQDIPRKGAPPKYDSNTEERILKALDTEPPEGYSTWDGTLLSKYLGDVSPQKVWRVLHEHGIHLQRKHSWCISTDPDFAAKAADIVGLYLNPPQHAIVICVDEKPAIQALERAQGWLRLPNGKAITGFNHEYKRHGTTTLFAALEVTTGLVKTGHFKRRRRREFLAFMNEIVKDYKDNEIHVILDNLRTHKPKQDKWLARHKNVHFHYTPTHASWLNQVEVWFSIMSRKALRKASFTGTQQVRRAIDRFTDAYNENAAPFEWKKTTVVQGKLKDKYAKL
jgi:transposase